MRAKQSLAQKNCFLKRNQTMSSSSSSSLPSPPSLQTKSENTCCSTHMLNVVVFVYQQGHISGCEICINSVLYGDFKNMDSHTVQHLGLQG